MDILNIKVNALSANESFLRSTVGAYCTRTNPSIETISDIKTAISEAVTNAIVHGYSGDIKGIIDLSAKIEDNVLYVTISDYGKGISNVEQALQDFYTTKADEERSGLGFTIMQSFMDTLEVSSILGEGTSVKMSKRLVG
ncbi:MAG: anti-sigma F factor [Clostridia bacterium]|nr:anti-sigma F factor [Clostridia bacterium]